MLKLSSTEVFEIQIIQMNDVSIKEAFSSCFKWNLGLFEGTITYK